MTPPDRTHTPEPPEQYRPPQLEDFDTIIVGFCDLYGRWRGKMLPAHRFRRNPTAPVQFSDYVFAVDRADGVIEPDTDLPWWPLASETGFRDLLLWPEPTTLRAVPWRTRTGLVLGNLTYRDESAFPAVPRGILAGVGERLGAHGLSAIVAAELEFVLLRDGDALHAGSRVYDVERFDTDEQLILPILAGLHSMGFDIDCWSVEGGVSQYEFNWGHGDLVESADQAFLFKSALRQLARGQGLTASFMAKNDAADLGSSMHLHQSLLNGNGANVFYDPRSDDGLSATARSFLAGQLDCMHDLTCLYAPTVNSYKRYVPGCSAGMNATWGIENPMAGVRAIVDGESGTRLEFRPPGADANPYLALTASLLGGLSGLNRALTPPPPSIGDASSDDAATPLPTDLAQAALVFQRSAVARDLLGADFVEYYAAICRWEADLARRAVTDWERQRYLQGP